MNIYQLLTVMRLQFYLIHSEIFTHLACGFHMHLGKCQFESPHVTHFLKFPLEPSFHFHFDLYQYHTQCLSSYLNLSIFNIFQRSSIKIVSRKNEIWYRDPGMEN